MSISAQLSAPQIARPTSAEAVSRTRPTAGDETSISAVTRTWLPAFMAEPQPSRKQAPIR